MWPVFPVSTTLPFIVAMFALALFSMRVVQPAWWSSRAARVGLGMVLVTMLVGLSLWGIGRSLGHLPAVHAGAAITYIGVLVLLPAATMMPIAAGLDRLIVFATARPVPSRANEAGDADAGLAHESPSLQASSLDKNAPVWRRKLSATRVTVTRRTLLRFGSVSLPVMAAGTAASGFAQAARPPTMPLIRMRYPGLHPDLEGLRILQLSDLHLGACLGLEDLVRGLAIAQAAHRPDLIVLTGDLADDAALIPGALRAVAEMNARYGALASLGNHEYLHDIAITRPLYEASPVPLLVGSGRSVRIGRATLFVGGADDPVHMGGDIPWMLTPSIERAAAEAPAHADFRLLLCHRPEGHGPATANGFDLTLSGHTHGGQLGMFGRSVLEKIRPGIGWWGTYAKERPEEIAKAREARLAAGPGGPSRLYTTSGFGHWFPFRVGCPTEMPVIRLEGTARPSHPEDEPV